MSGVWSGVPLGPGSSGTAGLVKLSGSAMVAVIQAVLVAVLDTGKLSEIRRSSVPLSKH